MASSGMDPRTLARRRLLESNGLAAPLADLVKGIDAMEREWDATPNQIARGYERVHAVSRGVLLLRDAYLRTWLEPDEL